MYNHHACRYTYLDIVVNKSSLWDMTITWAEFCSRNWLYQDYKKNFSGRMNNGGKSHNVVIMRTIIRPVLVNPKKQGGGNGKIYSEKVDKD